MSRTDFGRPASEGRERPPSARSWTATLARLTRAADVVGEAGFYREVLQACGARLQADLSMVMRYSRRHAPEYLVHDGLRPGHIELYLRGLYRLDPIYKLCRQRRARGIRDLAAVSTQEDRAGDYYNIFLRLTGMADDLVMLLPVDDDTSIGILYERRTAFKPREIAALQGMFPLIESLHRLHQRLAPGRPDDPAHRPGLRPIDHETALKSFLRQELTPRERDILHLVLLGYPNLKVAERLRLSVNTVKNHKKRMYLKLDITTERELFLAFVNFLLTGRTGGGPYGVHWQ